MFSVQGAGFRVQCTVFRVQGSGFRVQGRSLPGTRIAPARAIGVWGLGAWDLLLRISYFGFGAWNVAFRVWC